MKSSHRVRNSRVIIILSVALIAFASFPGISRSRAVSTSVNIVNNSSREIRNVYSSHVGADDWSADLLGEGTISAGQSSTVSNVSCDGQEIKIIAEDQDGCFLSTVITCGQSATWTVTNDTAKDCGY